MAKLGGGMPATDDRPRADRIAAVGYDYGTQAKERPDGCNLCGSRRGAIEVARTDRYGYPATLLVCGRCGLGYLSPRLTPAGYAAFYRGVYRPLVSAFHGRLIDAHAIQAEQWAYAADLADFLGPWLPGPPGTILDVGGSTGVVGGELAARFGARATVLDPAPDELAVAASAGMETVQGFAEDFQPEDRRWDLVLLCQTADHLLDVRATLAAMRRMTSVAGRAFVDVLDVGFVARRTGSVEGAAKVDHPYYLARLTATAYFAIAGYSVVAERMSGDGHWGFVLAPGPSRAPDWSALETGAQALLAEVWGLRADGPPRPNAPAGS